MARRFVFVSLGILALTPSAWAQEREITIDMLAPTLNGLSFQEYNMDHVTDLLGRPSAAGKGTVAYHELGLEFNFFTYGPDSTESLRAVDIQLATALDSDMGARFKPFLGRLTPHVDGNWKKKKIMERFAKYKLQDEYDEASIQAAIDSFALLNEFAEREGQMELFKSDADIERLIASVFHNITLTSESAFIKFRYEPNTTFLESVTVYARAPGEADPFEALRRRRDAAEENLRR
jgi:hypothetical protein